LTVYNRYILTVAVIMLLSTVCLIAAGQGSLDVYFTIYVIEALATTELYVHLNNKARRELTYVSTLLFGGFALVLFFQILKIFT
jgi:hypothetical protein